MFSGTFDRATSDKITLLAETGIIHAFLVVAEVRNGVMDSFVGGRD